MLSDQDYLDMTELGFFLGDLKAQIAHAKPTDRVTFAQKYFESTNTGMHVVGMPYTYILESNYNRRSLGARILEAFSEYGDGTDIQTIDFFYLVEALCPGFPRQLVLEISQCLKRDADGDGSDTMHVLKYLLTGTICNILYGDWLKLIAEYYADETSTNSMNALKIKSKLEDFYACLSPSVCQPPLAVIQSVVDTAAGHNGTGASSFLVEITLDHLCRTLYISETVRAEVRRHCR